MYQLLELDALEDIGWRELECFFYLTDEGISAKDAVRILDLLPNSDELRDVWNDVELSDGELFTQVVSWITDDNFGAVEWCADCRKPMWEDDSTSVGDKYVCEGCLDEYPCCDHCSYRAAAGETTSVGSYDYCKSCLSDRCTLCSQCEEWTLDSEVSHVGDNSYCESCSERYLSWCDDCDEYYHVENTSEHRHSGCECAVPIPVFRFPANGDGTVQQNERLTVELPAGAIAPEGIAEISHRLYQPDLYPEPWKVYEIIAALEPTWQTKRGNFTRRLSKAMYEQGMKVSPSLMSEIGNIARRHTASESRWLVEFTRDLNEDASAFCNEGSCWWGSESDSRCALKNWGGLGLRSYRDNDVASYYPNGRAWVQPLNKDLRPTHDTIGAHAYVVYNYYGRLAELEGYPAARIVAHLVGGTYRHISLSFGPQYVNSGGFLISDEETCANTDRIRVEDSAHYRYDADRMEVLV